MSKKNAIFTACNEKYGEFLIEHWLNSLISNVNLKNIDIVIFDYGLSEDQVKRLKNKNIKTIKCNENGHINILRFRDYSKYLEKHRYQQILATDGGDIIFQTDISTLFSENKNSMKAITEGIYLPFEELFLNGNFSLKLIPKIKKILEKKKMINAGVIIGPYLKFQNLCKKCYSIVINKSSFGPDQIAVNYLLYKEGVIELESGYNFVVQATESEFKISNGIFYYANGKKIPIVHNAGRNKFFRPVANFGFGKEYNRLKVVNYYSIKFLFYCVKYLKNIINFSMK